MKRTDVYWPLILLLALIKFVLPIFLQSPVYELQRDEYLYYEQGQHPAFGYLENPPLLSWLGMISSWFGGSEAWIKFWPCLFGAATLVITCLITAELGGGRFAQFLAGLGLIGGAYLRIHFLFQPNVLDIFFWTLAVYFLVRYITTQQASTIYGLTISLAVGWWGKYSIIFMAAAIVLGLLLTRHRTVFLKKQMWLAALIAGLIILPNAWWQYRYNWPLLHHMNELRETQLRYIHPGDFMKDQLLLLLPVFFVWISGLIWSLGNHSFRVLGYIYIIVIVLLIAGSGKSYYAVGVYPMLLAAGSAAIERWSAAKRWLRYALAILVIALNIPFIPLLLPVWKPSQLAAFYEKNGVGKTGVLKWEDQRDHPLPQDFADMLGWKELTERAERFYHSLPDSMKNNTGIYCRNYGQAGSLKYFGKDGNFRSKVFSDNGSFLLWIPGDIDFDHLIFIGRRMPESDDEVFQHFEKTTIIDSVTNPLSRQFGDKVIFFQGIDTVGLRLAREGLNEMKRQFGR